MNTVFQSEKLKDKPCVNAPVIERSRNERCRNREAWDMSEKLCSLSEAEMNPVFQSEKLWDKPSVNAPVIERSRNERL